MRWAIGERMWGRVIINVPLPLCTTLRQHSCGYGCAAAAAALLHDCSVVTDDVGEEKAAAAVNPREARQKDLGEVREAAAKHYDDAAAIDDQEGLEEAPAEVAAVEYPCTLHQESLENHSNHKATVRQEEATATDHPQEARQEDLGEAEDAAADHYDDAAAIDDEGGPEEAHAEGTAEEDPCKMRQEDLEKIHSCCFMLSFKICEGSCPNGAGEP